MKRHEEMEMDLASSPTSFISIMTSSSSSIHSSMPELIVWEQVNIDGIDGIAADDCC